MLTALGSSGMPTCRCPTGFTGPRCNQQVCTDYCLHNGSCTVNQGNQPNCRCLPTFIGDRCQYRECCLPRALVLGDALGRAWVPLLGDVSGDPGWDWDPQREWRGADPTYPLAGQCFDYCENDGVCQMTASGAKQCRCPPQFEGAQCQDNKCSRCQEGKCSINKQSGEVSCM